MRSAHPRPELLHRWLETSQPDRVGRHIDDCDQCMEHIELLSQVDVSAMAQLSSALAAPPVAKERASRMLAQQRRDREATSVLLDLFGVGGLWAHLMLDDDPEVAS